MGQGVLDENQIGVDLVSADGQFVTVTQFAGYRVGGLQTRNHGGQTRNHLKQHGKLHQLCHVTLTWLLCLTFDYIVEHTLYVSI